MHSFEANNKRLRNYVRPNLGTMSFGVTLKVIGSVAELFIPWLLAYLIDDIVPLDNMNLIFLYSGLMLLCAVVAFIFNVWANRVAALTAKRITFKLRNDLFSKIMYLSCRQMDEFTTPSVITRLTANTYDVNNMLGFMQRMGVRAPILLIGGIVMTFTLDTVLTLVLIATIPFIVAAVYFITKKGVPMYSESYKMTDRVTQVVRENISGIRVIKALSKTGYEKERFDKANNNLSSKEKKVSGVMAATNPLMNLFFNFGLVGVLIVAAFRVNADLTKPGVIIAFLTYFTLVLNGIMAITRIFVLYSRALASAKRIFAVINSPTEIMLQEPDIIETDAHIEFDNVTFSYFKQKNNLSNLSFKLKHGQTLGIIGGVGSGKTTVINLLMRFYDTDEGVIRIDGENVRGIEQERLYHMFGVAFQSDILFSDTISQNIDFYRGAPYDDISNAAASAQATEFIDNFPEKFEKRIAIKGADLSGGQKQRLLISRALSKNADIVILDDSSSALDYKTDAALRRKIRTKYKDATKIIVAQRVSSIKHSDLILVLNEGVLVGTGTHAELMKTCPEYIDTYKIQSGVE